MIWPPVCAEAAVAQLPVMVDPELKVMTPLVSASAPVLPPFCGLIVTLLVEICAPVVAWTAGDPFSVVLGAIEQDPVPSVTEDGDPDTVQVCATPALGRTQTASKANVGNRNVGNRNVSNGRGEKKAAPECGVLATGRSKLTRRCDKDAVAFATGGSLFAGFAIRTGLMCHSSRFTSAVVTTGPQA